MQINVVQAQKVVFFLLKKTENEKNKSFDYEEYISQ